MPVAAVLEDKDELVPAAVERAHPGVVLDRPRGAGLALAERVGVIEIDLPDGVRVRVDNSVNEKALRRVLSALRGSG